MLSFFRQIFSRFPDLNRAIDPTIGNLRDRLGQGKISPMLPVLGVSLLVFGGVSLVRLGGGLEAGELEVYDRLLQLRPPESPDPHLLIVQVTEADITNQKQWPLSGDTLYQVLTTIDRYEPAGIGLDIYRNIPVEPGHQKLSQLLATNKFITPICLVSKDSTPGVAPPARISPQRLGFANIPVDKGGIVRRALIFTEPSPDSPCQTQYSFGFHLARLYLQQQRLAPQRTAQGELEFNQVRFPRLSPAAGGYQQIDTSGYQLLLNYRCSSRIATVPEKSENSLPCSPTDQVVTLTDVLQGKLTRQQVEGKMVFIGVSAPSIDDAFYTPYSRGNAVLKMPGVLVHAQIASQLVSTALEGRRLLWSLPEWAEFLLLLGWSGAGAIGQWYSYPNPPGFGSRYRIWWLGGGLVLWMGTIGGVFFLGGWLPVVATGLCGLGGILGVGSYQIYRQQQQARSIAKQLQEQEKDLALLRSLLQEQPTLAKSIESKSPETNWETTALPPEALADFQADQANFDPEATAIAPPSAPVPQKTLGSGRYLVEKVLGSGGFGKTYRAIDTQHPQQIPCVIKHLQPARKDPRFLQVARRLFRSEGEILAQLGLHPQVPALIACFEEENDFYLVEELIPGHPLSEDFFPEQPWETKAVVDLLQQLLTVLDFIHRQGVIHRDLKPSNIIRTPTEKLVLIDFGAVKQITPQDPHVRLEGVPGQGGLEDVGEQANWTIAIGTRGYAPPEQYAGQPGFGSDIYALGMMAVQALTGVHPLNFPMNVATGEVEWHQFVRVSEGLREIIDHMIRFHFRDRYQSARKILEDIKSLGQSL